MNALTAGWLVELELELDAYALQVRFEVGLVGVIEHWAAVHEGEACSPHEMRRLEMGAARMLVQHEGKLNLAHSPGT